MRSQKKNPNKLWLKTGLLLAVCFLLVFGFNRMSDPYIKTFAARYLPETTGSRLTEETIVLTHSSLSPLEADQMMLMRERPPGSPLRFLFLGDTMMDGNVAESIKRHGMDYPLREFAPILEAADFIIVNLETAVGVSGDLMEKTYAFQTDPKYLELFSPYKEKLLFTLANNHGMDGPIDETLHALESAGFQYVGIGRNRDEAYRPYISTINGVSFAVFGASQVIPTADWRAAETRAGMATAYQPEPLISYSSLWQDNVDYIITYLHWGTEREDRPNQNQLELEAALREAGVNLIIGSHPHVLQAIEWNDDKQLTAYSMGNFVFTTSLDPVANETAALEVTLTRERIHAVKIHPAEIRFGLVRYLTDPAEQHRIFERIQSLSHSVRIDSEGNLSRK